MALLKTTYATLAAVLVGGCDLLRDPTPLELTEKRPSVHSMLVAGSRLAQVQVFTIDPARDPDVDEAPMKPVSGARVWLTPPTGGRVQLLESPQAQGACRAPIPAGSPAAGCYGAALDEPILAGVQYSLEVELPGGGTARGNAIAPAAPVMLTPSVNAHVRLRGSTPQSTVLELPLSWTAGTEAKSHEVALTNPVPYRNGAARPTANCYGGGEVPRYTTREVRADTLRIFGLSCLEGSGSNITSLAWDSIRAELRVFVYDSVYTRYLKTAFEGSVPFERASAGITGALGVFAGAAVTVVPVTILPPL